MLSVIKLQHFASAGIQVFVIAQSTVGRHHQRMALGGLSWLELLMIVLSHDLANRSIREHVGVVDQLGNI